MSRARLAAAVFWAGLLVSIAVAFGPIWLAPTELALGSPHAEGAAHLFGLWAGLDGGDLFLRQSELANFPAGMKQDLADPLHALFMAPALIWGLPGATLGWNLLALCTLVLAGVGGWRLGRQLFPQSPEAATILGLALTCSPVLQGVALSSGRTEYWAWAWMALPLSLCLSALRKPTPPHLALATVSMLPLAWSGWQALILGLLVLGPALLLLSRGLDRRWLLLFGGMGALASGALLAHHLSATDPWWISRLDPAGEVRPPSHLSELLPFTASHYMGDRLMLPGLALTAAAMVGARRAPRGWTALALSGLLLMFGPTLALGDTQLPGPTRLLDWLPLLGGVSAWPRLGLMVATPLAVLAAWAVHHGVERAGKWVLLLAPVLVAEGALFRPELPTAWYTHSLDPALEEALAEAPPGPILELPNAPIGLPLEAEALRDHDLLQTRAHGRPSSHISSPDTPAAIAHYDLLQALEEGSHLAQVDCRPDPGPVDAGFSLLLLHRDHMLPGRAGHVERILIAQWGPPIAEGPAWALFRLQLGVGDGHC